MPVLLFVHGTGVRGESYFRSLELIATLAKKYLPNYTVKGVQWGDERGAQLYRNGASIPNYDQSGGDATPALASADLARWSALSYDPFLELRLQPPVQVIGAKPGDKLWLKTSQLDANPPIRQLLATWNLDKPFVDWIATIRESTQWKAVISGISQVGMAEKVARAVTAGFQIWLRESAEPGLIGDQRDQLRKELTLLLGGPALGVRDIFLDGLASLVTPKVRRRRGAMADATSPAVGDILLYQARGEEIQNRIAEAVEAEGASVVLAHSLGGVVCADLLIQERFRLSHLVTVGSQAPYFYELNALRSMPYREDNALPASFPPWLNCYDTSDFLSYCGEKIFPGRVIDKPVNNGQTFPDSHSSYWRNEKEVWPAIADFLAH